MIICWPCYRHFLDLACFLHRIRRSGKPGDDVLPEQPPADPLHDSGVSKCPLQLEVQGRSHGGRILQEHPVPTTEAVHAAAGGSCEVM